MPSRILVPLIAALGLAGCATTLQDVNQGLSGLNNTLAAVSRAPSGTLPSRPVPIAPQMSAEQQASLLQALQGQQGDKRIASSLREASPTIKTVLEKRACNSSAGTAVYTAPGRDFASLLPMSYTPYHNKAACLSVARIHGWKMQALNALSFEVVYLADDSGETIKMDHEVVKQPDGAWLFSR